MDFVMKLAQPFRSVLSAMIEYPGYLFAFLFAFRYLRFVAHLVSYFLYRPSPVPEYPWIRNRDCSVIIPTCAPEDPAFHRCVESIAQTLPKAVFIVAVGQGQEDQVRSIIRPLILGYPRVKFKVLHTEEANKRCQIAAAVPSVRTKITVLCDDHVLWTSPRFLRAAVAPFEDLKVGGVGTKKRGIRHSGRGIFQGLWNVLGALYLERHNFEHAASNTIDGGVAVISGRTCLYRTQILQNQEVMAGYLNEKFFFGLFGPLNADDDNYLTRTLVKRGWKIKFQLTDDAMIFCDVGEYPKYLQQCLRWARTTFRSNLCSLITDRSVYLSQPWTVYALMISQMVNFALFWDAALLGLMPRTEFYSPYAFKALIAWILVSKLPKLLPYFWRHPLDLLYLPFYYAFAYFHSFIKLWAFLTVFNTQWLGRNLAQVNVAASAKTVETQEFTPPPEYESYHDRSEDYTAYPPRTPTGPTWSPSKAPHWSTLRPVGTPWGFVKPVNLHLTPANVLQAQTPGRSWPADFSSRKRYAYQDSGYLGDHSPVALQFEENLASQSHTSYPTPPSVDGRSARYNASTGHASENSASSSAVSRVGHTAALPEYIISVLGQG
ncbi:hypothetical protein H2200_011249 [Cladophialophora chaetospira]|uniref:Glycosyltransferase family 2 protein n=1 Tax=Cladophialophora chaetospira TaxID=386627 RepID=A0AA39CDK2_9EURO|nr:hypothetical protein H2200_011249 [Cladophialophora chaetospira]